MSLRRNRRAKIYLGPLDLRNMLDLPEGLYVSHVYAEQDPSRIVVVVEGESLESQPEDVELPVLNGSWSRENLMHHGRVWFRWGWMRS